MMGPLTSITDTGTSFLVDSVILLRLVEIESGIRKVLSVVKLRGSDHDKKLREYEITEAGYKVGSPFAEYEGIMTGSARRLSRTEEAVERFTQAFGPKGKKR